MAITVTDNKFTMPSGDVKVAATFKLSPVTPSTPYVAYTLSTSASVGNNNYAEASEFTQNNVDWSVVGNTTINPWRIGGKNLANAKRTVFTRSAIPGSNINKIEVGIGTMNVTTFHSLTLKVYSSLDDLDGDANEISSETKASPTASSVVTFNLPSGKNWDGKFFKFEFAITVSSEKDNKYIQLTSITFSGLE